MGTEQRFRAPVARGLMSGAVAPRVDRQAGIIRGASAMQAVEALGHGVAIDATTLRQVADLGNKSTQGVKVRFTHPGMCADGMGRMLGRMRNFVVEGDKVVGDIHMSDVASVSPEGDLRAYTLALAEEDPTAFGMSVVVLAKSAWKLKDGTEVVAEARPADAVGKLPFLRVDDLRAVDVVDEPAANRDGLFADASAIAAFDATTSADAAEAFAALDRIAAAFGFTPERVAAFLARYSAARSGSNPTTREAPAMNLNAAQVLALASEFPAHLALINERANAGDDEAAVRAALASADRAALAAKVQDLEAKLAKATADGAAALTAEREAHKATQDKLAKLSALGKAAKDPGADFTAGEAGTDEEALREQFRASPALQQEYGLAGKDAEAVFLHTMLAKRRAAVDAAKN